MGTFIIRPTVLSSGGSPYTNSYGTSVEAGFGQWSQYGMSSFTIPEVLASQTWLNYFIAYGGLDTLPFSWSDTIRLDFTGNSIYLDGSLTPISFAGLPAGFTALSAAVEIDPSIDTTTYTSAGSSAHYYLQKSAGDNGVVDTPSSAYNFSAFPKPSMLGIINDGCGFRVDLDVQNGTAHIVNIFDLHVEGTYEISASQFSLENPTVPIRVGDKVKIVAPATFNSDGIAIPGVLDGVVQVQLSYTDPVTGDTRIIAINTDIDQNPSLIIDGVFDSDGLIISGPDSIEYWWLYWIIFQQPYLFWFYIPWGFGSFSGSVTITLIGDGIQFSGSVVLGTLQVLYEDASGIYTLVKDQTNDILYFRDGYITDTDVLMLSDMRGDEIYYTDEDFFNQLPYPYKILSQSFIDEEDYEVEDFSMISTLRIPIVTKSVEIPSPFIRTAFLP